MRGLRGESGQTVLITAFFLLLAMIGFVAFAMDVGYLFQKKRMAQAAADAAAMAAAEEYSYPGDSGNEQTAANAAAALNGFTSPVTLTYPSTGNYSNAGSATNPGWWVQAQVSQSIPTFFLGAFVPTLRNVTVSATAVSSGGQSSPTCVCLEGTSGVDLNMSNNAKFNGASCGITVNSSSSNAIEIVGSANVCAQSIGAVASNWDTSSNVNNGGSIGTAGSGCSTNTKVVQGLTSTCSPPMPTAPSDSSCSADPFNSVSGGGAKYTVGPNSSYGTTQGGNTICYTALTVNGNGDTVTLNPGVYVINGGELHFESGTNQGGNGVFFYLENGASLVIDNGANVNLVAGGNTESNGSTTAPSVGTSGVYNGILFYQQASDTNALSVQGGSSSYFNGSIYAPGAAVTLGNGSGTVITSDLVAQSLTMNGGGTLNSSPTANLGTLNISVAKVVQ